ncbi:hypothetical protein SNE40_003082 [Patella caerulea]|uniref:Armadillo repeat protein deleted in velo-cardio-facial syndrome n=1 Tax=Patella caerulea TaxID=87958 RepID=A0AAN8PZW6_PATCE
MSNYQNYPREQPAHYSGSRSPSLDSRDFQPKHLNDYGTVNGRDASYPGSRNSYQGLSDGQSYPVETNEESGNYSDHNTFNAYKDNYGNEQTLERQYDDLSFSEREHVSDHIDPYYSGSGQPLYSGTDGYPSERNYQDAPYDPYSNRVDTDTLPAVNNYETHEDLYVINARYADTDLDGPNYRNSYSKEENPYSSTNSPRLRGSYSSNRPDDHNQQGYNMDSLHGNMDAGLPPVRTDPFADDPFRDGGSESSYRHDARPLDEHSYERNHDKYAPAHLEDNLPPYEEEPYNSNRPPYEEDPYMYNSGSHHDPVPYQDQDLPHYNDYMDYAGDTRPYYPETKEETNKLQAPVNDYDYSDGRRTPSDSGRPGFPKWRNPDLQEVIDYLNDEDDDVKAHAAAYLQHLCFMDDDMKAKTRGLDGIRPLVKLLSNDFPEVHRNACGALQNLSYGKANNENKKAIKNANGIPELIRLLRKTQDEDVKESVTGILWNLSSCEDLKKPVIDDGMTVLVNNIIIPGSGVDRVGTLPYQDHDSWTTVFRNGTGVIRNVSSAGYEARKKLRECRGLVNSLIHTLKLAADSKDVDNKPVENVVCTLRNLSYRIQEVQDPDFYKKRYNTLQRMERGTDKDEKSGCFGGGAVKKKGQQQKGDNKNGPNQSNYVKQLPAVAHEYKALWGNEVIQKYLSLIKTTSNPITLEAGAGAIQNLVACDWPPAVEIRANVRKEKGLPHLVDLLAFENDRVVCASATALRNLAIDERNKELVGKYAMRQLVSKLPQDTRHSELVPPDDTLCAVIATLYEVVKNNQDFAQSLFTENGVPRLMSITMSEGKYLARTIKYASTVLRTMWQFKALHAEYARLGYNEANFVSASAFPRPEGKGYQSSNVVKSPAVSNHSTPYNTLSRGISAQGYDDNTMSHGPVKKLPTNINSPYYDGYHSMSNSNSALHKDSHAYSGNATRGGEIPMSDLGPSSGYVYTDEHSRVGTPVLSNLPQINYPDNNSRNIPNPEPLYAQVNKERRRQDNYDHSIPLDSDGAKTAGGADSWV